MKKSTSSLLSLPLAEAPSRQVSGTTANFGAVNSHRSEEMHPIIEEFDDHTNENEAPTTHHDMVSAQNEEV